jgi:hypothetical protein
MKIRLFEDAKADLQLLRHHAGIHRIVQRPFHRLLSRRFPFAIYYTVEDGDVVIWAILDCRGDPAVISKRFHQNGPDSV